MIMSELIENFEAATAGKELTYLELINLPEVQAAYGVLFACGLMHPAPLADTFCAWCGEHIIFTPARNGKRTANSYDPEVKGAVDAHRAVCPEYQKQIKVVPFEQVVPQNAGLV
jgi:hypothetical protein